MSIQVLESATAEVFNVEALQRRCLGNQGLVDRVLRKFGIQLTSDLAELEQALALAQTELENTPPDEKLVLVAASRSN